MQETVGSVKTTEDALNMVFILQTYYVFNARGIDDVRSRKLRVRIAASTTVSECVSRYTRTTTQLTQKETTKLTSGAHGSSVLPH